MVVGLEPHPDPVVSSVQGPDIQIKLTYVRICSIVKEEGTDLSTRLHIIDEAFTKYSVWHQII